MCPGCDTSVGKIASNAAYAPRDFSNGEALLSDGLQVDVITASRRISAQVQRLKQFPALHHHRTAALQAGAQGQYSVGDRRFRSCHMKHCGIAFRSSNVKKRIESMVQQDSGIYKRASQHQQ